MASGLKEAEMAHLEMKLLGTYHIFLDGTPIDAQETDKARALLAYLAIENDRPHSREKLAGIFWGEQDEGHARGSLSQALYHLRGTLGDRALTGKLPAVDHAKPAEPFLLVSAQEIQFNARSNFESDASSFNSLVGVCKTHAHSLLQICDDCLKRYREATQLYKGDFLDGFYLPKSMAFEEWVTVQREHLHLEVMHILERLVIAFERKGDLEQSLGYARRMVKLDELSEAGCHYMMHLLALMGRHREALVQYDTFHQSLAIQMGAEPGKEVRTLYQCLRNEENRNYLGRLPASLMRIVGRRPELDDLWVLLRDNKERLINILGPGGCGKTRLALEAAGRQRYSFMDGVYFVPLSALRPGGSFLAAIAEGLDFTFRENSDPKEQLLDYLRHKKVLLVLDSFETVVENAGLVSELLSASERSKALVTSRVRLNVSEEHMFPLAGMSVPPADTLQQSLDYSAVELFLEAARRVRPDYVPEDIEKVGHICRLVEGMPLSLLLASSWVSDYSVDEIAAQMESSLDFLSVEWADLPERQHSLRATFEYSWNLLNTNEQSMMMDLATFRNPFTQSMAVEVAGVKANDLRTLVSKSMLINFSEGRYLMHDLIRQYSEEKLAAAPEGREHATRQKHSDYFLRHAGAWGTTLKGPQQPAVLTEADDMIEDVKAAWEWAAGQADIKKLWNTSEGLLIYFSQRYRFEEGEQACRVALECIQDTHPSGERFNLEGWLMVWQSVYSNSLGKLDLARHFLDTGAVRLEMAQRMGQDIRCSLARLWNERGNLGSNLQEQYDCYQRSAALYQELGDTWRNASMLGGMADIKNFMGNPVACKELYEQGLALSRIAGDKRQIAGFLTGLAYHQLFYGSWEAGSRLMIEGAELFRTIGDPGSLVYAEGALAYSLGWTGRFIEACDMFEILIEKQNQLGDRVGYATCVGALGTAQLHSGKYKQARITMENALELLRQDEVWRWEAFCLAQMGCLELRDKDISSALSLFQQSVDKYRQMGFVGEVNTSMGGLALAQHFLGQEKLAWDSLREALTTASNIQARISLLTIDASLIIILADSGKWEQVMEAYSVLLTDPIVANSHWFADMIANRMELTRQNLSEDAYLAAEARGRDGDVFDVLGRLEQEIKTWDMAVSE